jgi:UDP-glucose 4-epimerase
MGDRLSPGTYRDDGRRALITGGAGFVGSHVCDTFLAEGYDVVAMDNLATGRRENVPRRAVLEEVDIVDASSVRRVFDEFRPNVVCHLAAQSSVTVSVASPDLDLAWNVEGTFQILEEAKTVGAPLIFASTGGALYGDDAPVPTAEDAISPRPLAPYGASKLAGEAYVATWGRLHGIPNVVLRLGNVYGPRQSPHGEAGVVAIFSDRLLRGEPPIVFGDGTQTRDYIHVGDVARAFLIAAHAAQAGTYNVGWGVERSVLDLLGVLQRAAGTNVSPCFEPLRRGELRRSALDAARLRALGWEPTVEFEEGLRQTFSTYAPS